MKGLLLKDILIMRKVLRSYILLLLFYLVLAVLDIMPINTVIAITTVIIMILPISVFSLDERVEWDRCAAALPTGRRGMVAARYLFSLLVGLFSLLFGLVLCAVSALLGHGAFPEGAVTLIFSFCLGLYIQDILLLLCFRLGPERARPWMYAVIFLPVLLVVGVAQLGLLDGLDLSWLDALSPAALVGLFSLFPLAVLAGFVLSWRISCRIVARKEF